MCELVYFGVEWLISEWDFDARQQLRADDDGMAIPVDRAPQRVEFLAARVRHG